MESNNFIKEKYNETANSYAVRERRLYWVENHCSTARSVLEKYSFDIVIDIGCGTGAVIEKLAPLFPDVNFFGVDFSEGMIKIAKDKCSLSNVSFLIQDISDNPEPVFKILDNAKKILILAMGPLEYYNSNDAFTKNLALLFSGVKQGGFICTYLNNDTWGRSFFNKTAKGKRYWSYNNAFKVFAKPGDICRVRFTSFILQDLINKLKFFDRLFLFNDKILSKIPAFISKRIAIAFETNIIRMNS